MDPQTFEPEVSAYSPGQFVPNIMEAMGSMVPSLEPLSFVAEAINWLTIVLMSGWLEKFPGLRVAVLESNASWLPLGAGEGRGLPGAPPACSGAGEPEDR